MHSPAARALLHHPRDTLKDLILAGHVITITYTESVEEKKYDEEGKEMEKERKREKKV